MVRKTFLAYSFWFASSALIATSCTSASAELEDACAKPYQCPAVDTINCFPPVAPEQAAACSGECHEWIAKNCNVQFTY